MPSNEFIRRLQRHYAFFKRRNGENLPPGCSSIELIDEDDLQNWFIQLVYKDENGADFFIALRVNFSEEKYNEHIVLEKGFGCEKKFDQPTLISSTLRSKTPKERDLNTLANASPCHRSSSPLAPLSLQGDHSTRSLSYKANKKDPSVDDASLSSSPVTFSLEASLKPTSTAVMPNSSGGVRKSLKKVIYTPMPRIFIISPRITASFIHHGVVCSLELISQYWEHNEQSVSLLISTLYHTLNPFDGTSRVTVGLLTSFNRENRFTWPSFASSSYTDTEHRDGLQFIACSHPHLFRQRHHSCAQDSNPVAMTSDGSADASIREHWAPNLGKDKRLQSSTGSNSCVYLDTVDKVKYALYPNVLRQRVTSVPVESVLNLEGKNATTVKNFLGLLNTVELLKDVIELCRGGKSKTGRSEQILQKDLEEGHREDFPRVVLALTRTLMHTSYEHPLTTNMCIARCDCRDATANALNVFESRRSLQIVLELLLPLSNCPHYLSKPSTSGHAFPSYSGQSHNATSGVVEVHLSGRAHENVNDALNFQNPCDHFRIALVLRQGDTLLDQGQNRGPPTPLPTEEITFSNAHTPKRYPDTRSMGVAEVPVCVVGEGFSLTLSELYVYGHLKVRGKVQLYKCHFVGTITCEGSGQLYLENCRVGIDIRLDLIDVVACIKPSEEREKESETNSVQLTAQVALKEMMISTTSSRSPWENGARYLPNRHEGILVLDLSKVEIGKSTLVAYAVPLVAFLSQSRVSSNSNVNKRDHRIISSFCESILKHRIENCGQKGDDGPHGIFFGNICFICNNNNNNHIESDVASFLSQFFQSIPAMSNQLHNFPREHRHVNGDDPVPVLYALIFITNSAKLFVHDSYIVFCNDSVGKLCRRVVFAEQNASVDINSSTIVASSVGAICIQSCQGLLHDVHITNWRNFYDMITHNCSCDVTNVPEVGKQDGGKKIPTISDFFFRMGDSRKKRAVSSPTSSPAERSAGIVVEQGGSLTARKCTITGLYFGFSIITFSVAHFYGCDATYVVNGYTVDASTATFENCSAWTSHVGVFVLNQAKCEITENGDDFLAKDFFGQHCSFTNPTSSINLQYNSSQESYGLHAQAMTCDSTGQAFYSHGIGLSGLARKPFKMNRTGESLRMIGSPSKPSPIHPLPPKSDAVRDMRCYYGETYGIEVRGATLRASGIQVLKAQRACIYAYPQHRPEVLSQPTARDGFDNSFTNDWPASIVSDINLDKCMFCSPSAQRALLRQIKTGNTNPYHNHELGSSNTGNPFVCRSSLTLESVDCKGSVQVEDEEYFNILNDISVINASGRTGKQYSLDNGSCYSDERHIVTYQGNDECGVKLINSKAKLHHCITVDLRLAFVIKREMTASFEGCFAVGSYIGFLVEDNSMATLRDCGACAKYIALLVRNHSCVEMDSSCSFEKGSLLSTSDTTCTGPESQVPRDASFKSLMRNRKLARSIGGLLSNIFVASLNGVECESSVVQCRRVSVLPVSGCAFHVHGGSTLHLAESRVLLSSNAVLHTLIESQKDRDIKRKDEEKDYGVSAVNKIDPYGTVRSSYDAEKLAFFGLFQLHYLDLIKSSTESVPSSGVGLKVWSNSTAYIRNTEVRGGAYGVVAIGPEARVFAEHLRILAAQHGLKIESAAQAELVDCFISSLQYSVHVSANARCLIQKGSYSGRCFGIICTKNSLLHIKNSVKISRFCRAGIYLSKSAIMETEEGSRLEVKESFKEDLQEPIQVVSAFDPPSSKRIVGENRMSVCVLFESHARAIIHCAILGGGAAYGVRAQTGAFAFFQHCNIQNVRLIGLHVLSSSSVYMDQGSTIDVLNEQRHHRDYLIQPQYPLPEAFEYTPTIPSLDAFPYSLVVEHGAVCTFLSLDNTPHSLSRCWFNLNRPRDPFFFCVSIYTCVLSTLKVLCLLQHLRFLWLSSRLYMCLSKAFQRDVSIPFRIPIGRFWGRVGLPLQWTMRILLHTYRYPAALLHKVKFGANIFVNKQSKIAVIRSRRPTSLAFADASMQANNFSYRSIGQSSSITNERGEFKFHARYQPAPVVSNKFCSTSHTHVRGLRFWQSGKSKTHWSAPLPFVSRVSGRIHVLGECNLYEVSLKLPLCLTVRPKGSPCDMSLFTMNSNTGSKAVEYEGTQGQDQTQALESSRVNNASDKGVCLCHAPMIVSNSGSLTLRRCNLTCLTKGVSLPLRLDLSTFDYHMLCCSGPSARAHLCEVHIKIASLQSDAANDMTKSPCPRRLITHYFPYCYAKVVIHASRKGTIVLCRVTNESLCSFQEPPPSLSAKSLQGGAMRTELDDLDFLMRTAAKMIPKDNSRAKETGCGNSCSCDPNSATNLKIVSVLSPTLLHISVYASEQCSVHIYQTFLHHLFASRKAKLTLTQSAIMGAASVTQIESGAMLHLQQSLLVGSLIGI